MQKIAIVLACLAYFGCGHSDDQAKALSSLLLASNPAAAFNPAIAGARSSLSAPIVSASGAPRMQVGAVTPTDVSDETLAKIFARRIEELTLEHPDTIDAKYVIAMRAKKEGDLAKAKELLSENCEVLEKTQGYDALELLKQKDELAAILRELGEEAAAEEIETENTRLRSRSLKEGRRAGVHWAKIVRYNRQIAIIKKRLAASFIILAIGWSGLSVPEQEALRNALPDETGCKVIKNSLMKRSTADFPQFAACESICKETNAWFFCTEDSFKPTLKVIQEWQKEFNKKDSHPIKGGAMDGMVYDEKGVIAVSKLPGRPELMQKIAFGINSVPTKLGRGLKMVPTKLGRGLHLASKTEELARGIKAAADKGTEKGAGTMGDI